jgi:hypothetical protein
VQRNKFFLILFLFSSFLSFGQEISDSVSLRNYILEHAEEFKLSKEIVTDPKYRFQLVYTQVDHSDSIPQFSTNHFGTHQYYYPASLIKFPIAMMALEKMLFMGIYRKAIPVFNRDVVCKNDKYITLSETRKINFGQMIEDMMALSDNNFYSSFYHFLTPLRINELLDRIGYEGTNIYKDFSGCDREDQLKWNSYQFYSTNSGDGRTEYVYPFSELDSNEMLNNYSFTERRLFGSKHENEEGDIVSGPYDLNYNLELPLTEVNDMLIQLMYPETYKEKFEMRNMDRQFLIESMQKYPREVTPSYPARRYWKKDNDLKYAIIGEEGTAHKTQTTSKLGLSYGFTSEFAHVKNEDDGVEFFMSVSWYTNANDIVNDGEYEYTEVARPFVARLSKLLYAYELEKSKKK